MENKIEERAISLPKFTYAGFWLRFFAFIIDMLVISGISKIFYNLIFASVDISLPFDLDFYQSFKTILGLLYFFILTYLTNGQTLGKMIVGIRVISINDERLSILDCLSREVFARYFQGKILILYLIVGISPEKQSLADLLCDTVVIRENILEYVFTREEI